MGKFFSNNKGYRRTPSAAPGKPNTTRPTAGPTGPRLESFGMNAPPPALADRAYTSSTSNHDRWSPVSNALRPASIAPPITVSELATSPLPVLSEPKESDAMQHDEQMIGHLNQATKLWESVEHHTPAVTKDAAIVVKWNGHKGLIGQDAVVVTFADGHADARVRIDGLELQMPVGRGRGLFLHRSFSDFDQKSRALAQTIVTHAARVAGLRPVAKKPTAPPSPA